MTAAEFIIRCMIATPLFAIPIVVLGGWSTAPRVRDRRVWAVTGFISGIGTSLIVGLGLDSLSPAVIAAASAIGLMTAFVFSTVPSQYAEWYAKFPPPATKRQESEDLDS